MSRFTQKQKKFIKYMVIYDVYATAASKAGYKGKNIAHIGWELMQKPHIAEAVEKERKKQLDKLDIKVEEVLQQYYNLAMADINDYFKYTYDLKNYAQDRTYDLLKKYIGVSIDLNIYESLPMKHKNYYYRIHKVIDFDQLTKAQRAAIQKVSYDRFGNLVLHLSNKETSLDALSKNLGIYEKDNAQRSIKEVVDKRTLNDFYNG